MGKSHIGYDKWIIKPVANYYMDSNSFDFYKRICLGIVFMEPNFFVSKRNSVIFYYIIFFLDYYFYFLWDAKIYHNLLSWVSVINCCAFLRRLVDIAQDMTIREIDCNNIVLKHILWIDYNLYSPYLKYYFTTLEFISAHIIKSKVL